MKMVIKTLKEELKTVKESISDFKKVTKISGQDPLITKMYQKGLRENQKYLSQLEEAIKILNDCFVPQPKQEGFSKEYICALCNGMDCADEADCILHQEKPS